MREMLKLEDALETVLDIVDSLPTEQVGLTDAVDRVLAEDIYSDINIPPFDRSPLDGYAVRAEDTINASKDRPVTLKVIEEVPAGFVATKELKPMTAIKILTGAPIPKGADEIIRYEDTKEAEDRVTLFAPLKPMANVCLAGEDLKTGDLVLRKNTVLNPAAIGIFASLGRSVVPVFRKPKVAILSTGDELVDVHEPLKPGKIRNSNLYMLAAYVKAAGGEPHLLGIVSDRLKETTAAIEKGIEEADLVISTGGVSVGDYDVVKDAILHCGAQALFWKVAVKPGTPVVVGEKGGKLIFGLSGNPAGASIVFEVLAKPVIKKMSGKKQVLPIKMEATLEDQFVKKSGMRRFLRGRVYQEGESFKVALTGKQTPGVIRSLLECNALIDVPAGSEPLASGNKVEVFFTNDEEM